MTRNSTSIIAPLINVSREVHRSQSEFHDIVVADTVEAGRVLILDSVLQTASADEFFYHEMLCHVPLLSIDNPKRILIVGAGSGALLRHVLMHPSVQSVTVVELDSDVVEIAKLFLPMLNDSGRVFSDPRVSMHFQNAAKFIETYTGEAFDCILIDSTDPGPHSSPLFEDKFYENCRDHLSRSGILVVQTGAPTLARQTLREMSQVLGRVFSSHGCYVTSVPTFMCGYFTLSWASHSANPSQIALDELTQRCANRHLNCLCYSPRLHLAAFELPVWYQQLIESPT